MSTTGLNKTSQCAELHTSPSQSISDEIAFGLLEGQAWERPEGHIKCDPGAVWTLHVLGMFPTKCCKDL